MSSTKNYQHVNKNKMKKCEKNMQYVETVQHVRRANMFNMSKHHTWTCIFVQDPGPGAHGPPLRGVGMVPRRANRASFPLSQCGRYVRLWVGVGPLILPVVWFFPRGEGDTEIAQHRSISQNKQTEGKREGRSGGEKEKRGRRRPTVPHTQGRGAYHPPSRKEERTWALEGLRALRREKPSSPFWGVDRGLWVLNLKCL